MSVAADKFHLGVLAISCIVFGAGITACGFIFQYHDDFNANSVNFMNAEGGYRYYYTQYWLGIPLVILGVCILPFLCSEAKCLLYFYINLSILTLALAITAAVLEAPKWSVWLSRQQAVNDYDSNDVNGTCVLEISAGMRFPLPPLSCQNILYATIMQSIIAGGSIVSIIVSQFIIFMSIRILGSMSKDSSIDYEMPQTNSRVNHAYNNHSFNVISSM